MESKNRAVWIFVAVVLVVLCCVTVAVAAVAGWLVLQPARRQVSIGENPVQIEEGTAVRLEQSFELGEAPRLWIDNFAGSVVVRAGEDSILRVEATKKGAWAGGLARIQVEMLEQDGGLLIRTRKPQDLSNASVQLEITAPAGTRLDLQTGAGSIEVRGLRSDIKVDTGAGSVELADVMGRVDAHTGAGSVTMTDVSGRATVETGAGSIEYTGAPSGDCRFESGTGSITLEVPAVLGATVDLGTGVGTVSVRLPVDGQVTRHEVKGVIGGGGEASIYAHTGTGSVDLLGH